jgi:hypothetical protein
MTHIEWIAEAERLFGPNPLDWKFTCPACGYVATVREYRDAGAPETAIAFSCVGRWVEDTKRGAFGDGEGPCDYAGAGLIQLNPVKIEGRKRGVFAFAEASS